MKLLVKNTNYNLQTLKGLAAYNFEGKYGLPELEVIRINLLSDLEFSIEEIQNNKFLSTMFKNDNELKIALYSNKFDEYRSIFEDLFSVQLDPEYSKPSTQFVYYIEEKNKMEFIDRLGEFINNKKYLSLSFKRDRLTKSDVYDNNEKSLNEFVKPSIIYHSCVDYDVSKYILSKDEFIEENKREIIHIDKCELFKDYDFVVFSIANGKAEVIYDSGYLNTDIMSVIEKINMRYIKDILNEKYLTQASKCLDVMYKLISNDKISDKYENEINRIDELRKVILKTRKKLHAYKINIKTDPYFTLTCNEALDFEEEYELSKSDIINIYLNEDMYFSEEIIRKNPFLEKIFKNGNKITIEFKNDINAYSHLLKNQFDFSNGSTDKNVEMKLLNKFDFISEFVDFYMSNYFNNKYLIDGIDIRYENNEKVDMEKVLGLDDDRKVIYKTLIGALKDNIININDKLNNKTDDIYTPKNRFWLDVVTNYSSMKDLTYLKSEYKDDLIIVDYLYNNFAIPIEIIADWINYPKENILDDFFDGVYENMHDTEFI